jgi:hypothetical protein
VTQEGHRTVARGRFGARSDSTVLGVPLARLGLTPCRIIMLYF